MFRRSVVLPTAAVCSPRRASCTWQDLERTGHPSAAVRPAWTCLRPNRRPAVAGLYDWSRAGYRGGADLPGAGQVNPDPNCQITAAELDTQYGVRPGDGADDTGGIQAAIDAIKSACSPSASYTKLSLLSLPAGTSTSPARSTSTPTTSCCAAPAPAPAAPGWCTGRTRTPSTTP